MTTQAAAAPAPAAAPESQGEKKGGWFWKLIVLGLIAAVIGAEPVRLRLRFDRHR